MSEDVKDSGDEKRVGCVGSLVDVSRRTLDAKNRLTISSSSRLLMGHPEYVYLVPGVKGDGSRCVDLLPPDIFDSYFRKYRGLPGNHEKKRFLEIICSTASQVMIDSQGRIRIPDKFLEYLNLKGDVIMSGAFDRIKIWPDEGTGNVEKINHVAYDEAIEELQF